MKLFKISVKGRVFKVGYRFSAMETAYRFGILGIVKYRNDRSVYIEAEGDEERLGRFLDWCKRGPMGSKVHEISIEQGIVKNYQRFDIV